MRLRRSITTPCTIWSSVAAVPAMVMPPRCVPLPGQTDDPNMVSIIILILVIA